MCIKWILVNSNPVKGKSVYRNIPAPFVLYIIGIDRGNPLLINSLAGPLRLLLATTYAQSVVCLHVCMSGACCGFRSSTSSLRHTQSHDCVSMELAGQNIL